MPTLREIREQKFLSQQELAIASKVAKSTIVAIEGGRVHPQPRTARALASALQCPPGEIDWPTGDAEAAAQAMARDGSVEPGASG